MNKKSIVYVCICLLYKYYMYMYEVPSIVYITARVAQWLRRQIHKQ